MMSVFEAASVILTQSVNVRLIHQRSLRPHRGKASPGRARTSPPNTTRRPAAARTPHAWTT